MEVPGGRQFLEAFVERVTAAEAPRLQAQLARVRALPPPEGYVACCACGLPTREGPDAVRCGKCGLIACPATELTCTGLPSCATCRGKQCATHLSKCATCPKSVCSACGIKMRGGHCGTQWCLDCVPALVPGLGWAGHLVLFLTCASCLGRTRSLRDWAERCGKCKPYRCDKHEAAVCQPGCPQAVECHGKKRAKTE
jgi:hypothetical protein